MAERWSKRAVERSVAFWGDRLGRPVSDDEARRAMDDFSRFFELLDTIDRREHVTPTLSTPSKVTETRPVRAAILDGMEVEP